MPDNYTPPNYNAADFNFADAYTPPYPPDFNFVLGVYSVLAGSSNIFTAIWADPDASRTNGKMYALSWGPGAGLTILDMATKIIYDFYTETESGRVDETLTDNNTRDLNVDTL